MKRVRAGVLDVAYREVGPPDGPPAVLLHGFPYDIRACEAAAERLAGTGIRCLVPYLRGYGPTRFVDAATPRSGEQAALGADLLAFLDALGIERAVLAGYDWGGRAACVVAALWPDRARGLVTCGVGYNIQNIPAAGRPVAPEAEHRLWYQYYLHGERGRAGLAANRDAFCRLLWQLWSPTWTLRRRHLRGDRAAPSTIPISWTWWCIPTATVSASCRATRRWWRSRRVWRPSRRSPCRRSSCWAPMTASGRRLSPTPTRATSSGPYRREIVAGVGHNFPQEASDAFAAAVRALV